MIYREELIWYDPDHKSPDEDMPEMPSSTESVIQCLCQIRCTVEIVNDDFDIVALCYWGRYRESNPWYFPMGKELNTDSWEVFAWCRTPKGPYGKYTTAKKVKGE